MTVVLHLPLVRKAAGIEASKLLPFVRDGQETLDGALYLCDLLRRIGVASFFLDGTPDELHGYLQRSAHAFLHQVETVEREPPPASKCEPFLDAVACGDVDAARRIAAAAAAVCREGEEYPADFARARFFMALAAGAADEELAGALMRWDEAAGGDDERLDVARALLEREPDDFAAALEALMDANATASAERAAKDKLDPDVLVTTARLSVEGVALLRLARARGVRGQTDFTLVPSTVFAETAALPGPDAWKSLPSFRTIE